MIVKDADDNVITPAWIILVEDTLDSANNKVTVKIDENESNCGVSK